MPEHDMEDIFREKLNDFAPNHKDRWEQIANALPPEENRRRGLWIWFTGIGACIVLGLVGINQLQQSNLTDLQSNEKKKLVSPVIETPILSEPKEDGAISEFHAVSEINTIDNTKEINQSPISLPLQFGKEKNQSNHNTENKILRKENNEGSGNKAPSQFIPPAPQANTGSETEEPQEQQAPEEEILDIKTPPTPETEEPNAIENPSEALPHDGFREAVGTQPKPEPQPKLEHQTHPWSFGIGAGAFYSTFAQKMPKNPGNSFIEKQGMVARNRDLRESMEQAGSSFTQSLWVEYKPFEHWSFSSGISMVQSTQNLSFNVQNVFDDSIRGPQDFPESGSAAAGGHYLFANDSILPGNNATATNKYYAREIPLYINYHYALNEKLSLQASIGISYRWVRSASVFMADIDNVGILRLDGPENYPGIRSTFHFQGGVGLNYRFNDYFNIQAMPSMSYSMQSNIRFSQYVQQYQRQWGMQLKLTRNLDF